MLVRKRDKTVEQFNFTKIRVAVSSAFDSCRKEIEEVHKDTFDKVKEEGVSRVIECLRHTYDEDSNITVEVETIQDNVERCLMASEYPEVAKSYIIYRYLHKLVRESQSKLIKNIEKKLLAQNVQNQNANVDEYSFGGRMGEASRIVTKNYALDNCMSRKARRNHENNEIYIHDLDSYAVGMTNCLSSPIDDLLGNGFYTKQTDVRPANSLNTAFQLVAVIFQLQSLQQFGGVSATHIDWTMVRYFRKSFMKHYINAYIKRSNVFMNLDVISLYSDDNNLGTTVKEFKEKFFTETGLTEEDFTLDNKDKLDGELYQSALYDTLTELSQAVEGMYHNLNTLQSRSGNQLPFTSINYGTCTLPEGRLITRALLYGSLKGVGKHHKTAIFPCNIFQCMKGVNREPGDPNYDLYKLALKSTSQRIYPNYVNVDWSINEGYDKNDPRTYTSTMGCRTYNGYDINAEEGVNPQMKDGRGNLAPVTIILPTLAMQVKDSIVDGGDIKQEFIKLLEKKISESKDMLLERYKHMCNQSASAAKFMWENGTMYGYKKEEGIESALKHGTLAIGQLGLAEALQILIGKDHTSDEGMELAKEIESTFYKKASDYKKKYKLNFGVYYTPAENLCYTAMTKFKSKYGDVENVTYINKPLKDEHGNLILNSDGTTKFEKHEKNYFTNSMHVPVWLEMSPFEKIDIESQLVNYSNAGCITYVELPASTKNNIEALETIVNYAMDKDIPYFAVNVPNDTCVECGYTGEINGSCPSCGSDKISRLRRVTGYLTGDYLTDFNPGKQCETKDRIKHIKSF